MLGVVALGYLVLSFVHATTTTWRSGTAATPGGDRHRGPARRPRPPGGAPRRILGRPALLWLGLRSYSFYLWHWPVLVMTRPGVDIDLPRGILIPLQLILCLILADLSYRFVELPFNGKAKLPGMPELAAGRPPGADRRASSA